MRALRALRAKLTPLVGAVVLTLSFVAAAAPAAADHEPPDSPAEAAAACREHPGAYGLTSGECVNFVAGPASGQAGNQIAASCGLESVQAFTGTTNKSQCLQAAKQILRRP